MAGLRILYHLARADFLERVRRYSFLVTLAATVWLGYLAYAGYIQMNVGDHRGLYNSAWTGTLMATSASLFVSLAGFYVVKNALQRDRESGVGQILAATRMRAWLYLPAKWLSNFAVLAAILVVLALAAIALQMLRAEGGRLDAWELLAPFLLLSLPAMAVVASLALLFETVPWLAGGVGNVVYFFFCTLAISIPMVAKAHWADWTGLDTVANAVVSAERAAFPGSKGEFNFSAGPLGNLFSMQTFTWRGVSWTPSLVGRRLLWIPLSVGLAAASALWSDRFDPAPAKARRRKAGARAERRTRAWIAPAAERLTAPLLALAQRFRFTAMAAAELRILLRAVNPWWYAPAVGMFVAMLVSPLVVARAVLPYAWLWPVLSWSKMGAQERRYGTGQILFSAPHPLRHQLAAVWLAGVLLAALTGGSFALRLALAGDPRGLAGWLVGGLFIPSLALALGVWSGSSKLFEAVYIAFWYIGPAHATPALDFTAASVAAARGEAPGWFLAATGVLLAVTFAARRRQLRS